MAVAPITLYLDLEDGASADLEIVAAASIAWSRAIKELAFIIDPSAEVRVELRSGTEGSLGLNTLIRLMKGIDRKALPGIMIGLALWFGKETAAWVYGNFLDDVTQQEQHEQHEPLSDEDVDRIAEAITKGAARQQIQRVYREVERDPAIKGVGITVRPGVRPDYIVPRAEFRELAGYGMAQVEDLRRRHTPDMVDAILIKPVLVVGSRRKWRFQTADGEVGFVMDDDEFVANVLRGQKPLGMLAGIILTMEVVITEQLVDGVWTVTDRHITRVLNVREPDSTLPLSFGAPMSEPEDDDD